MLKNFFPSFFMSFSLFHSRLNFINRISWLSVLYKNTFPQIKITAKLFSSKIYSRGNTVFTTEEYSTKKSCLFHYSWSLFFRNKYWRTLSTVWKSVFLLHLLNKNENIMNAGNWVLSEIAKINPQQEKPVCPNRKN